VIGRPIAGSRARILALVLVLALAAIAALAFAARTDGRSAAEQQRPGKPRLMLLTTLPLVFGEEFGLDAGSPALTALERRYEVAPISVADRADLGGERLLLMAHPLPQPAEALVDLDSWVRGGGRLLLLADPMLEWHSERPLGDRLRPPPAFADTGLLKHWGLRLDAPDERGPRQLSLAGEPILTASPGALTGSCAISKDRLVARCSVGKGEVSVVADADFLNVEDLDGPTDRNLEALLAELEALHRR
jgi:hypothetical protein